MISCETPNQRLNYVFSCHLLAQVQIKIGKLEGERTKPTYKQLLETPHLNYSGALQHLDLYVSAQIFSNNQALCMPVKTSYRYIEKQPWVWDEWLTLPLKISDLPRNSQLAITAWDIESPQSGDVPVCAACISLFDKFGEFRQGVFEIRMWPNRVADGSTRTTTPGIVSDVKELELEEHNGVLLPTSSEEQTQPSNNNTGSSLHHSASAPVVDEFPILDELDRLAKMSKYHYDGHMIKQDWLDRLTLKEIQNATKKEKFNSKFFFMAIEFAQIKCEDVKYKVLYYEEDNIIELKNRKLMHSKQMGILDMYLKPDTESKNLLHKIVNYPVTRPIKGEEQALLWKYRYYLTQNKKALTKFLQCFDLNLEFEGNALMELMLKWQPMDIEDALELLGSKYKNYPKIRSYAISRLRLASNKDLILYLLQLVQALRYENFNQTDQQNMPTIQSITTSNGSSLTGSSSNGSSRTASTTTSATRVNQKRPSGSKSSESGAAKNSSSNNLLGKAKSSSTSLSKMKDDDDNNREEAYEDEDVMESEAGAASAAEGDEQEEAEDENDEKSKQFENFKYSSSPPATLAAATSADLIANHRTANLLHEAESISKKAFDSNLKSFLLQRACQNEIVALNLYWFVKVEIKDTKILSSSSSNAAISQQQQQQAQIAQQSAASSAGGSTSNLLANAAQSGAGGESYANQQGSNAAAASSAAANASSANDQSSKTNFQIFMDELIDSLRNGDSYARSIYENIISQEKFLKSLNDVVRATSRESGTRDKKVIKLRTFLNDTGKSSSSSFDLVDFDHPIPLIIDPSVRIIGINVDKTTMFKSNLMPCKFVFKTLPDLNTIDMDRALEYSTIYKIGDDLRQDQLVLQMIALMDKLLKQENLDLKLTPYKVVATGIKEGFLQFVDALAISNILANSEFRTIKEYLKKNNPSDTDKHGISAEAMDNYVRSCAGYMVITYILGVGDRHYDNILITKCGKILHVDFGYILGRDPKPFQPVIKWTKDMADGMGGRYGPDGKETKEYEDFKKYCCNAFLHLRRHANLILNLFSLMVDANIPDIALEPDKTVKKLIERFKLDVADEQAQYLLIREIESNYDSIVGNITDIIHTYSTAQK